MAGKRNKFSYLEKIGNRRILKLAEEYQSDGYFCYNSLGNNAGVDIIVMTPDYRVVEVIESTNYAREDEWICEKKFERYVQSLNFWTPIKRTLVVSYESNLSSTQRIQLKQYNINVRVEGKQD
jgi:hypothetical protein